MNVHIEYNIQRVHGFISFFSRNHIRFKFLIKLLKLQQNKANNSGTIFGFTFVFFVFFFQTYDKWDDFDFRIAIHMVLDYVAPVSVFIYHTCIFLNLFILVVVVVSLFYVYGKQLWSCGDGQLT